MAHADYSAAGIRLFADLLERFDEIRSGCGNCALFDPFHAAVARRLYEVQRLMVACSMVTGQPDLQHVLQLATMRARGLLSADMSGVLTLDEKGQSPELFQVAGFDEIPSSVPEAVGLLHEPYTQGAIIRRDRGLDEPDAAWFGPTRPPVGHCLAVPLLGEGRAIGTIFVANKPDGRSFSVDDELLLLVFAGQVVAWIENERLHTQSRQLALLQERQRLAQTLHNTVVQGLFSIGLQAIWCLDHASLDSAVRRKLRDIQRLTATSSCQLRGAIYALSDPHLSQGGSLISILEEQVADFQRRSGVAASLIVPHEVPDLGPEVSQAIYRIVCESLANVQKHAQAKAVFVTLRRDGDFVVVTIEDDGVGLPKPSTILHRSDTMHFGVAMMRQLTTQLGGGFLIANSDDGGVIVRARFDLSEDAES